MRVVVTQEDIKNGQRKEEKFCPIALAIKRQTGEERVRVYGASIYIGDISYQGLGTGDFVEDFDNDEEVAPQEFELVEYVPCKDEFTE